MNKPHKHADLIKAWADGAIIQCEELRGFWMDTVDNRPSWNERNTYRIKPVEKKKVTRWLWALKTNLGNSKIVNYFYTQEEVLIAWPHQETKRLDWSATEFEE